MEALKILLLLLYSVMYRSFYWNFLPFHVQVYIQFLFYFFKNCIPLLFWIYLLNYHNFKSHFKQVSLIPSVEVGRHCAVGMHFRFYCLLSVVSYDLTCWTLRTALIPGVLENQHFFVDASNTVQNNTENSEALKHWDNRK